MRFTFALNVQNMKPVQFCTGFIFCTLTRLYTLSLRFSLIEAPVQASFFIIYLVGSQVKLFELNDSVVTENVHIRTNSASLP